MNCVHCHLINPPGATWCAGCDTPLPPSCTNCGAPVPPGDELCRDCRTDEMAAPSFTDEDGEDGLGAAAALAQGGGEVAELPSTTKPAMKSFAPPPVPPDARRPPPLAQDELRAPQGPDEGGEQEGEPAVAESAAAPIEPAPEPVADGVDEGSAPIAREMLEIDLSSEWRPPLVGRGEVLARLRGLVEQVARERRARLAVLSGAPGVGKTRLVEELGSAVRAVLPEARVYLARCGGRGAPPFAAFGRLLAARFGIGDDDSPAVAQARIAVQVMERVPESRAAEVAELIAGLVAPTHGEPHRATPTSTTTAGSVQLEARTFIAIRRFLAADAGRAPLVLIFDDAQRAAPEAVKLIHYLAVGLEGAPLLLLVVGRPELYERHPGFHGADDLGPDRTWRSELGPLSPDEAGELFEVLTRAAGEPPASLSRHVRERLGGSPRAILELVRYLLDTEGIKRVGARHAFDRMRFARVALARGAAQLPGTIDELLTARLQALPPAQRDLLEKAAACGPVFWVDAVLALVRAGLSADPDGPPLDEIGANDRSREQVEETLAALAAHGIVVASPHSRIRGEREFHFAYPPWWEVAERSLGAQARRRYHRLIAQWLELRPAWHAETEHEEVARHLELAGDGEAAAQRYRHGADAARSRYYHHEAIRLYRKALACVGESDLATRIQLWHDLGSVYQLQGDHEPAMRAFEHVLRLAWVVAARPKLAVAYNKMGRIERQRGELLRALAHLERGLELFRDAGDERGRAGSLDDIAQVLWLLGRYDEALARGTEALEERRRLGDEHSVALSLLTIGHVERHLGRFEQAEARYREALAVRRGLDDRAGIAACLNGFGALAFQRGDFDGARAQWEEAIGHAEEAGVLPLVAVIEGHLGEVARARGNPGEARARFEQSERAARELGDKRLLSEALRNLSALELAAGEVDRARDMARRAFELADGAGIPVDVARALVALGEVHGQTLFAADEEDEHAEIVSPAEAYFRQAVELLRDIGNEAELGVALERFGAYRIERGDFSDGKQLIAEAQAIFERLGMKAFGDAARRTITELE